jgi:hypothetical protein
MGKNVEAGHIINVELFFNYSKWICFLSDLNLSLAMETTISDLQKLLTE